jgi:hypothetical protein
MGVVVAVAVFAVVAHDARATDAPAQPEAAGAEQPADPQAASDASTAAADAGAQASQTDASNTNVVARVGQPGANGAVTQTNGTAADASAAASSGTGAQDASADGAASGQAPSNLNLSVRVDSPGADGAVTQANDVTATANAGADGGATGNASATAAASQPSPVNVNVSVRVASPGSGGAVDQSNTAAATAGGAPGASPTAAPGAADADATIANTAGVEQSLGECQADCPSQPNDETISSSQPAQIVAPHDLSTTASATQINATNVNISVRVASPGHDGAATQTSTASADAVSATATKSGESNVNVSVVLPGTNVVVPSGSDPWVWNWVWSLDTTPTAAAAPTASADWVWSWASAAPTTGAVAPVAGRWIWTWQWTASNGVASSFSFDQACACSWIWNWTWTGDAQSASTTPAAAPSGAAPPASTDLPSAPDEDVPGVTQTNAVSASASATASSAASQTVSSGGGADRIASGTVLQTISSTQLASADAQALQVRPANLSIVTAGVLGGLSQENGAHSSAAARVDLAASQRAATGGAATVAQAIASTQSADASAQTVQNDATNRNWISSARPSAAAIGAVEQRNDVNAAGDAASRNGVDQSSVQTQSGPGPQAASSQQASVTSQAATASAQAAQTGVTNANEVTIPELGLSNPALTQSNTLSVHASVANAATTSQTTAQASSNLDAVVLLRLDADQQGDVRQSGQAGAAQAQADRLNLAAWNGVLATPALESSPQRAGTAPAAPPETAAQPLLVQAPPLLFEPFAPQLPRLRPFLAVPRMAPVRFPTRRPSEVRAAAYTAPALAAAVVDAAPGTAAATGRGPASRAASSQRLREGPRGPAPACTPCGADSVFGAIGGAHGPGSAGLDAALSRFRMFAPPGAGRVRHEAPALGSPVDVAPLERPG